MQREPESTILPEFLERLAEVGEFVDVNFAAGIAKQELDGTEERVIPLAASHTSVSEAPCSPAAPLSFTSTTTLRPEDASRNQSRARAVTPNDVSWLRLLGKRGRLANAVFMRLCGRAGEPSASRICSKTWGRPSPPGVRRLGEAFVTPATTRSFSRTLIRDSRAVMRSEALNLPGLVLYVPGIDTGCEQPRFVGSPNAQGGQDLVPHMVVLHEHIQGRPGVAAVDSAAHPAAECTTACVVSEIFQR